MPPDILRSRIQLNIDRVRSTSLVSIPQFDALTTIDEFVARQSQLHLQVVASIQLKNQEVCFPSSMHGAILICSDRWRPRWKIWWCCSPTA
jgi:hypothetical protein